MTKDWLPATNFSDRSVWQGSPNGRFFSLEKFPDLAGGDVAVGRIGGNALAVASEYRSPWDQV